MTETIVLGVLLAIAIASLAAVAWRLAVAQGARAKADAGLIKSMGDQLCAYNDTQVDRIKAEQLGPGVRAYARQVESTHSRFPADNGHVPAEAEVTIPDRSQP